MTWHDANLCPTLVAWSNDARAVWTDEADAGSVLNKRHGLHHVQGWNSFGDADNDAFALHGVKRIGGFHDGLTCKRWRHVDDRRISVGGFNGLEH